MAHHHYIRTTETKDCTHLAVVDGTSLTALLTENVDSFIIKGNAFKSFYIILAEMAHYAVTSSDRNGQSALVRFKSSTEFPVVCR